MQERSLPLGRSGRRRGGLQAGQAVEVSRGTLAGLSGVLVSRAPDGRWVVRLDGLQRGVLLVVDAVALKRRLGRTGQSKLLSNVFWRLPWESCYGSCSD